MIKFTKDGEEATCGVTPYEFNETVADSHGWGSRLSQQFLAHTYMQWTHSQFVVRVMGLESC